MQFFLPEIRPLNIRDVQFRISDLPEQEIADPVFSAGPDQKVRIGHSRGVKPPGNLLLIDLFRLDPSGQGVLRPAAGRPTRFLPARRNSRPVSETSRHFLLVRSMALASSFRSMDGRRSKSPMALSRMPFSCNSEISCLRLMAQKTHQALNFELGPFPVFGGKRIHGQIGDTQFARRPG